MYIVHTHTHTHTHTHRQFYHCQSCGVDMTKHQRHIIHGDSAISISMQELEADLPGGDGVISTWLTCRHCSQVSPTHWSSIGALELGSREMNGLGLSSDSSSSTIQGFILFNYTGVHTGFRVWGGGGGELQSLALTWRVCFSTPALAPQKRFAK